MVNVHESVLDKTTEENTAVTILAGRNLKDERNPQNIQNTKGIFGKIAKFVLLISFLFNYKF